MKTSPEVLWEPLAEGCVALTLNRPERGNALSASLVEAMDDALEHALEHDLRLLVLRGAGRHFCTGFDLSDLESETDDSLLARFTRVELMLQRIHNAPFSTLAIAHGRATGAGADLFCACTDRWIVGQASFAFPGAGFGLVLGTRRLAQTVGAAPAQSWIESGQTIDGDLALGHRLATRQVEASDLEKAIQTQCERKSRLDAATQLAIHQAVHGKAHAAAQTLASSDLALLVRSAARRGLKERIERYRAAQLKP